MKLKITRRIYLYFRFTTAPAAVGYGAPEEREQAIRGLESSPPDAVGTISTILPRIEECLRRAGLLGSSTGYACRITTRDGECVTVDDMRDAYARIPERLWHNIDRLSRYVDPEVGP